MDTIAGFTPRAGVSWALPVVALGLGALVTAFIAGGLTPSGAAPVPGIAATPDTVRIALTATRLVLDIAAAVTIGLHVLPLVLGRQRRAGAVLARSGPVAVYTALLWLVATLTLIVLQTVDYHPDGPLSFALIGEYVRLVDTGTALLVIAGLTCALTVLGVFAVRNGERISAELRTGLALLAALPLALTGHAGNIHSHAGAGWLGELSLVSITLHVLAVMTWSGGLLAVITTLAGSRELLAGTMPRFSALAGTCITVVAVTGVCNGLIELSGSANTAWYVALVHTAYGWLVLLKTVCVLGLAALGGFIRFWVMPLIVRHRKTGLALFAGAELALMGVAFGLASVLSRAPLPT